MNLLFWYRSLMRSVGAALVKLIATATSGLVSFTTNVIRPVKVTCEFSPIQEGTGDPSPDNVRPISGWTGCEIGHTGKNLLNVNREYAEVNPPTASATASRTFDLSKYYCGYRNIGTYSNTGNQIAINDGVITFIKKAYLYGAAFPLHLKPEQTYKASFIQSGISTVWVAFYNASGVYTEWKYAGGGNPLRGVTFTVPAGTETSLLIITGPEGSTISNIQFELGSTETAYEPYQGKTVPINWKLPDEYQEVEYLESTTAGQYIDTLVPLSATTRVETKFRFLSQYSAGYQAAFGAIGTKFCIQRQVSSTTNFLISILGKSNLVTVSSIYDVDFETVLSFNEATLNDDTTELIIGTGEPSGTIWLFGKEYQTGGRLDRAGGARFYYARVYNGDNLEGSFIPCYRKADSKPGMYDLVTGTFFVNQGTGDDFTVGPDASTLPGTVYGGTVTLNEDGSADLLQAMAMLDASQLGFARFSSTYADPDNNIYGPALSVGSIFKDSGKTVTAYSNVAKSGAGKTGYNFQIAGLLYLSIYSPTPLTTGAEALAYLESIGFYVVGTLKEPVTYHFDNIGQLESFLGTNNIWHDMNGSITAEYYKKQ